MHAFVITGGPSSGKSTLIRILSSRGYAIVPEAARMVILEEHARGVRVPQKDLGRFQKLVLARQLALEEKARGDAVFLDRGVVDGAGYCAFGGIPVEDELYAAGKGRYEKVFLLDLLGFYEEDGVRSRDFDDAVKIHACIKEAYEKFGYRPVSVPALPPEERADFILSACGLLS